MLASLTLTQIFGIFLGLYMLAAGIGLLTDSKGFAGMIDEFKRNRTLTYLASILAFAIGATVITLHDIWGTPLEIIVSLIGWAALVEGFLMLAFARPFFAVIGAVPFTENVIRIYAIFVLALGALLLFLATN